MKNNSFKKLNNFAYIDGANLYTSVVNSGWKIDFVKFRKWLSDKYKISKAYYFIGLIPKQKDLYKYLQEAGFTLVFKEVVYNSAGVPKGNCDADLVLQSVIDAYENSCDRQVIITSDGDYAGLIKFLSEKNKLRVVLSPSNGKKCSILLKRINAPITYLEEVRDKISFIKKKPPLRT